MENDGLSIYEQSTRYTDTDLTDKQEYQTQENNIKNKSWEVQADYTNKISTRAGSRQVIKGHSKENPALWIPYRNNCYRHRTGPGTLQPLSI